MKAVIAVYIMHDEIMLLYIYSAMDATNAIEALSFLHLILFHQKKGLRNGSVAHPDASSNSNSMREQYTIRTIALL